jgi:ribosome biogenesis protein ENP2
MVVSLASAGGAAKIYCVNGGGASGKNAAAWLEAKVGQKRRRNGGQGGTGGEGEIRLIQVSATALTGSLRLLLGYTSSPQLVDLAFT